MANGHWSQFSHRPKIFFFNPVLVSLSLFMLLASQKFFFLIWIVIAIWTYVAIFQWWLKMPLAYTPNLIRTWLTGKSKTTRSHRDGLEL